ncbi:hypothetical protein INR49_021923 [Caranx melampygus]|nr:hypothetical protein INR49_021923 [Caranx melampygus]
MSAHSEELLNEVVVPEDHGEQAAVQTQIGKKKEKKAEGEEVEEEEGEEGGGAELPRGGWEGRCSPAQDPEGTITNLTADLGPGLTDGRIQTVESLHAPTGGVIVEKKGGGCKCGSGCNCTPQME